MKFTNAPEADAILKETSRSGWQVAAGRERVAHRDSVASGSRAPRFHRSPGQPSPLRRGSSKPPSGSPRTGASGGGFRRTGSGCRAAVWGRLRPKRALPQDLDHGVDHRELPPVIVPPGQTPEPACDRKAEESHAPATLQLLDDRGKHELGHPGRPFHGDAESWSLMAGFEKRCRSVSLYGRSAMPGTLGRRGPTSSSISRGGASESAGRRRPGGRLVAQQPADMAERLVSGIEQADLDLLVGEHIGGHLGAGLLQAGLP